MLQGLKVIELASVLAGPSVGMFLAELGAQVVKVEKPGGGDVTRSWKLPQEDAQSKISAYYSSVNWGKEHVELDLTNSADLKKLHKLVAEADVVLASYKPGDAEKLQVDYDSLKKLKPDLIYSIITGYGQEDDRTGYDAVLQAEAGFMFMNGTDESGPLKMPVAMVDLLCAHQVKEAVLLALLKKERTGEGSFIHCSLLKSAVASLANQATNWLVAGHVPQRQGAEHPNIFPYGTVFYTADEKAIVLAIGTDAQFSRLVDVLQLQDINVLKECITNAERVKNREKLRPVLARAVAQFSSKNLLKKLHKQKIPAGDVKNMQEVFEQPAAAEMIIEDAGMRGVSTIAFDMSGLNRKKLHKPK